MKKAVSMILAAALAASMLAGCGSSSSGTSGDSAQASGEAEQQMENTIWYSGYIPMRF